MKKGTLLLLVLALALLLSGCNLIAVDPTVDANLVVVKVGNETVTKAEAQKLYRLIADSTVSQYAQLGYNLDLSTNAEAVQQIKLQTVDQLAIQIVLKNQLKAQGLDLTEAELQEIQTLAQTNYDTTFEAYKTQYYPDSTLDAETVKKNVDAALDAEGYSLAMFTDMYTNNKIQEKLRAVVSQGIVISDAEIQADYDTHVTEHQTTYTATPSQFATDFVNGAAFVVYRPEGYRYIKNLLLTFPEDIQAEITTLQNTIYNNSYTRAQVEQQRTSLGDKLTAEDAATLDGMVAQADISDTEANAKLAELTVKGKDAIRAKAEEVLALAKAPGADFDALLAEYGQDGGMKAEPAKTYGYPVSSATGSTVFDTTFNDAAMALASIGSVSDLVETNFGYHILLYAGDVPAGPVPLAEVKDAITAELTEAKQTEAFDAKVQEWIDAVDVKTYPDMI